MFSKTLDNKKMYITEDGLEFADLSESIFDPNKSASYVGIFRRVPKSYEMRPDLVSNAVYGTTDYTEMIMKYSCIPNPFALEEDDIIYSTSVASIYNTIVENEDETQAFDALKNYHKYIDKSKVPDSYSQENDTVISDVDTEANLSEKGDSGIVIKNGKVYFGEIDEELTDANSDIVDCAENGVTIGEFINATIKNY